MTFRAFLESTQCCVLYSEVRIYRNKHRHTAVPSRILRLGARHYLKWLICANGDTTEARLDQMVWYRLFLPMMLLRDVSVTQRERP